MDKQRMIDRMYAGDRDAIMFGIASHRPILVMNAIMAGTKAEIRDERFLVGISRAKESEEILLGIPLKKVAVASEHLLGVKKYAGDDRTILAMIRSGFGI